MTVEFPKTDSTLFVSFEVDEKNNILKIKMKDFGTAANDLIQRIIDLEIKYVRLKSTASDIQYIGLHYNGSETVSDFTVHGDSFRILHISYLGKQIMAGSDFIEKLSRVVKLKGKE